MKDARTASTQAKDANAKNARKPRRLPLSAPRIEVFVAMTRNLLMFLVASPGRELEADWEEGPA